MKRRTFLKALSGSLVCALAGTLSMEVVYDVFFRTTKVTVSYLGLHWVEDGERPWRMHVFDLTRMHDDGSLLHSRALLDPELLALATDKRAFITQELYPHFEGMRKTWEAKYGKW